MKARIILMTLISLICFGLATHAQSPQEVTLTVSSDGPTKDDATKNALRSAIEQSFGTFVSANTTILNDEMVKDEIVTLSNGSIKEYKEISCTPTGNGSYFVTLTATVSLPNLITYAKSHGSECEFAGNAFNMEMKLFELQKKNELTVLYNLSKQIELMLPVVMEYKLTVSDPYIPNYRWAMDGKKSYYYTHTKTFKEEVDFTICLKYNRKLQGDLGIHVAQVDEKAKKHIQPFLKNNIETTLGKYYAIPMTIEWVKGERYQKSVEEIEKEVERLIADHESTLSPKKQKKFAEKIAYRDSRDGTTWTEREYMRLSLTEELKNKYAIEGIDEIFTKTLKEISIPRSLFYEYKRRGLKTSILSLGGGYFVRNSDEDISAWVIDLFNRIDRIFNSFVIVDNTGVKSDFFPQKISDRCQYYNRTLISSHREDRLGPNYTDDKVPMMQNGWIPEFCIFGTGIFHNYYQVSDFRLPGYTKYSSSEKIKYITGNKYLSSSDILRWEIEVLVPRDEIGKYSKFWIETK